MTLDSSDKSEILKAMKEDKEFRQEIRKQILNGTQDQSTQNQAQNQDNDSKLTRRDFLKTLGLGASGLALTSLGASTVEITDQGIRKDGSPLTPFLAGTNTLNSNLDIAGQNITDGTDTIYNADNTALNANNIDAQNQLTLPTYSTLSNAPTTLAEGTIVYIEDENKIYVEDGT